MSLVLRPYRPADARPTRLVFESAVRGTASAYYTEPQIEAWCPPTFDDQAWARTRSAAWTLVAECEGSVVGFADLTEAAELDMLFVAASAGGQGVGRRLVAAVLDEARRRGYPAVTTRASRAARPVLEGLGFVVDHEQLDNTIRGVVVPNFSMHIDLVG